MGIGLEMRLLDVSLQSPHENIALDEALLDEAEAADSPIETLRVWESSCPVVVVGRGSRVDTEVHRHQCRELGIPIVRRCSGGAAIVAGPGCLMYAVVLSYQERPILRMVDEAHCFVLKKIRDATATLAQNVSVCGTSDLAMSEMKFSGNSLKCRRKCLLYHGTLLYDFSTDLVARCLKQPPRQPAYRNSRDHTNFITNLNVNGASLRQAIIDQWSPQGVRTQWPKQGLGQLVARKYTSDGWNLRHL